MIGLVIEQILFGSGIDQGSIWVTAGQLDGRPISAPRHSWLDARLLQHDSICSHATKHPHQPVYSPKQGPGSGASS